MKHLFLEGIWLKTDPSAQGTALSLVSLPWASSSLLYSYLSVSFLIPFSRLTFFSLALRKGLQRVLESSCPYTSDLCPKNPRFSITQHGGLLSCVQEARMGLLWAVVHSARSQLCSLQTPEGREGDGG